MDLVLLHIQKSQDQVPWDLPGDAQSPPAPLQIYYHWDTLALYSNHVASHRVVSPATPWKRPFLLVPQSYSSDPPCLFQLVDHRVRTRLAFSNADIGFDALAWLQLHLHERRSSKRITDMLVCCIQCICIGCRTLRDECRRLFRANPRAAPQRAREVETFASPIFSAWWYPVHAFVVLEHEICISPSPLG